MVITWLRRAENIGKLGWGLPGGPLHPGWEQGNELGARNGSLSARGGVVSGRGQHGDGLGESLDGMLFYGQSRRWVGTEVRVVEKGVLGGSNCVMDEERWVRVRVPNISPIKLWQ